MSADSTNLLMAMVEKVCAPVLEQVLDKIEIKALQEASARLREENAELRRVLQIPPGTLASAEVIAVASQRLRQSAVATPPAQAERTEPPVKRQKPARALPTNGASLLLWPFAKVPAQVQQLAPVREVPPAWVVLYLPSLAEDAATVKILEKFRSALQTEGTPYGAVRRRTPSRFIEFIW